jgi:hypothetical protein
MATRTIRSVLLFVVCLVFTANLSAQQILTASELTGTYVAGHNFGGSSINLQADGTYSQDSGACTMATKRSGKYFLSDGIVRFTILKYTGVQFSDESKEIDLFNSEALKEFFGYGNDEKVEPPTTEFSLVLVKWGERVYLIDDSNLRDFSNAINLGLEPRPELRSEPYYGSFFLREGDLQKSVTGKPSLPAEWQTFLLGKPVTAKIVAIETQDKTQIATINRGSRDGLKVGMKLLLKDQEPSLWSRGGEILSVETRTAKVEVYDLKVGDILNSKFVSARPLYR